MGCGGLNPERLRTELCSNYNATLTGQKKLEKSCRFYHYRIILPAIAAESPFKLEILNDYNNLKLAWTLDQNVVCW